MPLQPGEYRVTVSLDGFQTFARNGVIVDALSVVGLNATLQIGNITQEVVVTAEAPPLATADARLGQTIRNEVYTALPFGAISASRAPNSVSASTCSTCSITTSSAASRPTSRTPILDA
jgi:hypothetical protein